MIVQHLKNIATNIVLIIIDLIQAAFYYTLAGLITIQYNVVYYSSLAFYTTYYELTYRAYQLHFISAKTANNILND